MQKVAIWNAKVVYFPEYNLFYENFLDHIKDTDIDLIYASGTIFSQIFSQFSVEDNIFYAYAINLLVKGWLQLLDTLIDTCLPLKLIIGMRLTPLVVYSIVATVLVSGY